MSEELVADLTRGIQGDAPELPDSCEFVEAGTKIRCGEPYTEYMKVEGTMNGIPTVGHCWCLRHAFELLTYCRRDPRLKLEMTPGGLLLLQRRVDATLARRAEVESYSTQAKLMRTAFMNTEASLREHVVRSLGEVHADKDARIAAAESEHAKRVKAEVEAINRASEQRVSEVEQATRRRSEEDFAHARAHIVQGVRSRDQLLRQEIASELSAEVAERERRLRQEAATEIRRLENFAQQELRRESILMQQAMRAEAGFVERRR